MIMMILFMCIRRVKSMYYILLLSQMAKLQFCSESNSAAIFQLNSLPGKIFFKLQFGNFSWENWEKRWIFWIRNGAYIRPLMIERKGPEKYLHVPCRSLVISSTAGMSSMALPIFSRIIRPTACHCCWQCRRLMSQSESKDSQPFQILNTVENSIDPDQLIGAWHVFFGWFGTHIVSQINQKSARAPADQLASLEASWSGSTLFESAWRIRIYTVWICMANQDLHCLNLHGESGSTKFDCMVNPYARSAVAQW